MFPPQVDTNPFIQKPFEGQEVLGAISIVEVANPPPDFLIELPDNVSRRPVKGLTTGYRLDLRSYLLQGPGGWPH